jgi:eukaryotic-like serine/threonine-protein kinase
MTSDRWEQVEKLYHAALEVESSQRVVFLDRACAGDGDLRREVESLLAYRTRAENFIESPAIEMAAGMLAKDQHYSSVGRTIGSYQVISLLGAGAMGEVYLAQDGRLGRKIALKLLPKEFTNDQDRVRRFEREARAASALNHPNILTIYDIGQADGTHYIATELVEGQTLRRQIANAKLNLSQALDVGIQIASALQAAHQAGIVHRDIKPENIMLRPDGILKVLDFGLAKLTERPSLQIDTGAPTSPRSDTEPGTVMGTVHYMSPEQARGLNVDARTDLFSLGVVLYEMVAGRAPFEGNTPSDVIVSILEREPPPLARYLPETPKELQRIVLKTLRKDIEERYQTSKDLLIDLKSLKDELEFEARLEHSASPDSAARHAVATKGTQSTADTAGGVAIRTEDIAAARTTSSAEYLVGEIKRYKKVIAALATILVVSIAAIFYSSLAGGETIDSLAVLPFVNAGADPNTEFLSDGITESIIYSLSRLPNLKVMSRSSVMRYKGAEKDPQVLGRELGVRAIMTGRVIQRGDGLSISAELVDSRDNRLLWGQQYNRRLSDILLVQEEIAREISEKLRLRLTGDEKQQLGRRYTDNTEAYQLYLKGRFYWYKRTRDGYKKATELFEQAIEKDPLYALAYTGLADCYNVLSSYGISSPNECFPKGRAAATKALEIDDNLAEAHTSLAQVRYYYEWDWAGAESEFKRAIALNPNYATAHQWYALALAAMGRMDEAIREIKRTQELDPLSLIANVNAGWILYHARRYDESIEQHRKSLDMDPNFARAYWAISEPYEQVGRYQEAIAALLKARQLDDTPIMLAFLGHIYAREGKRGDALKTIGELKQSSTHMFVDPYFIAEIYAALGEADKAFAELNKAYEQRSSWLLWLKVEPKLDSLRSDPRFANLLQRIGLAP